MDIRKVTDMFYVAGQIQPPDLSTLKNDGFTTIINNRPDGEMIGQPNHETIAMTAYDIGIDIVHIPIRNMGLTHEMIELFDNSLLESSGKTLAFCRTGTRSINLWGISQSGKRSPEDILQLAQKAGYNLSNIRAYLAPLNE